MMGQASAGALPCEPDAVVLVRVSLNRLYPVKRARPSELVALYRKEGSVLRATKQPYFMAPER